MEKKPSKFDLIDERSDQLNEIIGKKPRWVIHWGSTLIFVFILLLLILSYLIKYPDIVYADVIITKSNPPIRLHANASGNISLRISEGDTVKKGDLIVIINNAGNNEDLIILSNKLDSIKRSELLKAKIEFDHDYILGDFQALYSNFLKSYNRYSLIRNDNPFYEDSLGYLNKIRINKQLKNEQLIRVKIANERLNILNQDYKRDLSLYNSSVIAKKQLEDKESIVLQAKDLLQSLKVEKSNTELQIAELEHDFSVASIKNKESTSIIKQELISAFDELKNTMDQWRFAYTIIAPEHGIVSYTNLWTSNQFIEKGDEVIALVPSNQSEEIFGLIRLPITNSGKVKPGMRVNIILNSYPDHEYGILLGQIESVSDVLYNGYYQARISLPKKLITSYNIKLPFQQELKGEAEVVTEDLRLIERLFLRVKKLINQ